MFNIYKNKGRDFANSSFFNIVPSLVNTFCPLPQSLLYALRINCFELRDKPCMYIQVGNEARKAYIDIISILSSILEYQDCIMNKY
jgi:hypothetical protein